MNGQDCRLSLPYSVTAITNLPPGQGKYIQKLANMEEENSDLRKKVDLLLKWKEGVETWMLEEFGAKINTNFLEMPTNPAPILNITNTTETRVTKTEITTVVEATGGNGLDNNAVNLHNGNGSNNVEVDGSLEGVDVKVKRSCPESRIHPEPKIKKRKRALTPIPKSVAISLTSRVLNFNLDEKEKDTKVNEKESGPVIVSVRSVRSIPKADLDDRPCDICRKVECEEDDEMVFCDGDGCNVCVHQGCYGIPEVPSGSWKCKTCVRGIPPGTQECMFCPYMGGGPMTRCHTPSKTKWAHMICAEWIPELTFGSFVSMEPVINIGKIDKMRKKLCCSLCKIKERDCIQCSYKRCAVAYHPMCALKEGLRMDVSDNGHNVRKYSFCKKHTDVPNDSTFSLGPSPKKCKEK